MTAKIMLVEDDTNLSDIYKARFEAEGFHVSAAKDGEEALALAVKEKPDLIISDIMMPKISGFEMLDILRSTESIKSTKVIMMTALGQSEDKVRAEKLGADRYLVKSQVTLEDVVKAVHEVLSASGAPAPAIATPPATSDKPTPATITPAAPSTPAAAPAVSSTTSASASNLASTPAAITTDKALAASPEPTATTPVTNIPVATPTDTSTNQLAAPAVPAPSENLSSPSEPSSAPVLTTKTIEELETVSQAAASSDGALGKPAAASQPVTITPSDQTPAASTATTPPSNSQSIALNEIRDFVNQAEAKGQAEGAKEATPAASEPTPPPSQSSPVVKPATATEPTTDNVSIANKKIIAPVSDGKPKFDLQKALAAEEIKENEQTNIVADTKPAVDSPPTVVAQANPSLASVEPLSPATPPATTDIATSGGDQAATT